jgi:putative transposase
VLLRREGEPSGINRIYRLYSEEGLTVRKRKARRKALGTRAPILVEARANARPLSRFSGKPLPGNGIAGLRA